MLTASLKENPPQRGELKQLAARTGMSAPALYGWRRGDGGGRPARPPRPQSEREDARKKIATCMKLLAPGHRGWRSVQTELAKDNVTLPTQLIQETVRELKASPQATLLAAVAAARVRAEVLVKDGV